MRKGALIILSIFVLSFFTWMWTPNGILNIDMLLWPEKVDCYRFEPKKGITKLEINNLLAMTNGNLRKTRELPEDFPPELLRHFKLINEGPCHAS